MNILLLCEGNAKTRDSWSGLTKSLVDELRRQGHTVYTGDVDLYGWSRWRAAGLTFSPRRTRWRVRYRLSPYGARLRSRKAARHIARHRERTDVILQIGATFEPQGRGKIPYVLYCDSNIRMAERGADTGQSYAASLHPRELGRVVYREAEVYRGAAAIFAICDRLRRSFSDDFGLPDDRVHTVYAGPNLELARIPEARSRRAAGHPPTVLFVGRQFARKGGDLLLDAFRRVRRALPEARLLVVGPPDLDVDEPGASCLGFLKKDDPDGWNGLVEAYRSADVFCLPTRFEPFGVAFLEAMHFGLPCIGTDAWAIPEIILDGKTGFRVPADDVEVLADRLVRLLSDPALARRMGELGLARARALFTWQAVVKRVSRVLEAVVNRPQEAASKGGGRALATPGAGAEAARRDWSCA